MKVLYHSTSEENAESILRIGLRPSVVNVATGRTIHPRVFLARTPFWAAIYHGGGIVLKVYVRDTTKLRRSHLGDPSHEYLYRGTIPPEDIEVLGPSEEFLE